MMSEFMHKTVRCEWQIVNQSVGQYGEHDDLAVVVLSAWPTYEEAAADRPNHGYEHEYVKGRWIPNGAGNYQNLEIRYREVLVKCNDLNLLVDNAPESV